MRILAVATLIMTISAASSAYAQAYNPRYPVCFKKIENFGGETVECAYTSLPQCQQTALGLGGQCVLNPFYYGSGRSRRY